MSYSDYDLQTEVAGDDDGSIMFGMGFGDPAVSIGGEVTVAITSVSTGLWGDGKFADEGNVSVKIHKHVSPLLKEGQASPRWGPLTLLAGGRRRIIPLTHTLPILHRTGLENFRNMPSPILSDTEPGCWPGG